MQEQNTECPQCGYIFKIKKKSHHKGKIVALCPQCRYDFVIGLPKNILKDKPKISNTLPPDGKRKIEDVSAYKKSRLLEKKEEVRKRIEKLKEIEGKLSVQEKKTDEKHNLERKMIPSKKLRILAIILIMCGIFMLIYSAYCLINYKELALHHEVVLKHEEKTINSTTRLIIDLGEKKKGEVLSFNLKLKEKKEIDIYILDEENHMKLKEEKNATPIRKIVANSSKKEFNIEIPHKDKYFLESLYSNEETKGDIWYYNEVEKGSSWSKTKLVLYSIFVLISSFIIITAGFSALKVQNFNFVSLGSILFAVSMILSWFSLVFGIILFVLFLTLKNEFSV